MADPAEPKTERIKTVSKLDDELVLPDIKTKKEKEPMPEAQGAQAAAEELQETSFSFAVKKDSSLDECTEVSLQADRNSPQAEQHSDLSLSENTLRTFNRKEVSSDLPATILDRLISFFASKLKALEEMLSGKKPLDQDPELEPLAAKTKTKKKKKKGFHDQPSELSDEELEEISTDRTL